MRHRHGVEGLGCYLGLFKGLTQYGQDVFDVGASGDFGDDAAVFFVQFGLRSDHGAEDATAVGDNGRCCFITGTLQAQYQRAHRVTALFLDVDRHGLGHFLGGLGRKGVRESLEGWLSPEEPLGLFDGLGQLRIQGQ